MDEDGIHDLNVVLTRSEISGKYTDFCETQSQTLCIYCVLILSISLVPNPAQSHDSSCSTSELTSSPPPRAVYLLYWLNVLLMTVAVVGLERWCCPDDTC